MKFKEIKPGMIIHCPKEENARALLEHLTEMGYEVSDAIKTNAYRTYKEKVCFYINPTENVSYGDIDFYAHDEDFRENEGNLIITEFSDLIEPDDSPINSATDSPMTAKEIICWLKDNKHTGGCADVFGSNSMEYIFSAWSGDTIVEAITAYEAAKKAPKPVEVEWMDRVRIIQVDHDMKLCVYEEDIYPGAHTAEEIMETILKEYVAKHEGEHFAVIERVCRVKESKS